ncbi:MAG: hypothetical protein ACE5I7_02465 [Candidatus Binatia bacterium]
MWYWRNLSLGLAVVLFPLAVAAQAQEQAQQIKELRREVEALRAAVRSLQKTVQELQAPSPAAAVAPSEEEKALEAELRAAMPAATPAVPAPPAPAPVARVPAAPRPLVSKSSAIQNPDISFNGDFTFLGTDNNQLSKANRFSFREAEIGFQAAIDPFARADAFINFDENGTPDIEEAYATFLTLPFNLQARTGKFRVSFGKNNLLHRHALPQTDRPFVVVDNFGEEGLMASGGGVSYLVPNPWDQYVLLTGEVVNDISGPPEGPQGIPLERRPAARTFRDFAFLGHMQSFFDLNPDNNVELGGSLLVNLPKSGTQTKIYGVDLTYRWRPVRQAGYRQFRWRSEAYFTQKQLRGNDATVLPARFSVAGTASDGNNTFNTAGFYTYGVYRLTQRLWAGTRFDWTEIPGRRGQTEWGVEPYVTFAPTEFGFFRLAYQHARSDQLQQKHSNRVWLQYNFSLGPHAAHAF